MEKNWKFFADKILKMMADNYEVIYDYSTLLKMDMHWQDYRGQIEEAANFLIHHNLVNEIGTGTRRYRCSSEGKIVAGIGIEKFIALRHEQENKNADIKNLSLVLLQEQIIDMKRKNRNWHYAVIAGVISFVYNLLQIFNIF